MLNVLVTKTNLPFRFSLTIQRLYQSQRAKSGPNQKEREKEQGLVLR